jgi:hypothetical protein
MTWEIRGEWGRVGTEILYLSVYQERCIIYKSGIWTSFSTITMASRGMTVCQLVHKAWVRWLDGWMTQIRMLRLMI